MSPVALCVLSSVWSHLAAGRRARPVYKRWRGSSIELLWLLIWALIHNARYSMLSDLWAHVWPAPCTVTQNDSPSVGVDLLRDWLGPVPPGWSIFFFFLYFCPMFFFQCRGVHCIDQGSVLHVRTFRTACTVAIFLFPSFCYYVIFFPMYGSALLSKSYA